MEAIIQDNIILCDNKDINKLVFKTDINNDGILDVFMNDNGTHIPLGHICVVEDNEVRESYEDENEDYTELDYNYILINYEVTWLNSIKFI